MKIGLDFDGVISDCGRLKSDGAKRLYGLDLSPSKLKKEIVVGQGFLTLEQYKQLQDTVYCTREVGLLMGPVEGALNWVSRLVGDGHSITVVTSRGKDALEIAKEWSTGQGLELEFVGVGFGNSKAKALNGFDIFIDDDLDKLEPLVGVVEHRFLFSWDYNSHLEVGDIASRVDSWEELYLSILAIGDSR